MTFSRVSRSFDATVIQVSVVEKDSERRLHLLGGPSMTTAEQALIFSDVLITNIAELEISPQIIQSSMFII